MSKRGTSYNDENPNESSDSDERQEGNAKRVKLTLSSDTTLQDLPIELLESLFVKVVAMEVKGMKLVKSVWKEKADLVISRLSTDCDYLQWNNILTSKHFRSEVHKILDGTAQEKAGMELLQQSPLQSDVITVATMRDEIFMLCKQPGRGYCIAVYDRNNLADVKDVIALPGIRAVKIVGSSTSNCVYVLQKNSDCYSVSLVAKAGEHQFNLSPWIGHLWQPVSNISVSSNGNLIVLSRDLLTGDILSGQRRAIPGVIKIYNSDGSLQHRILLSTDISSIRHTINVIQKSDGNLLLVSYNGSELLMTEINTTGRILRQCKSSLRGRISVSLVDIQGRILTSDRHNGLQLFDSELNPLDLAIQEQYAGQFREVSKLHYNSERNEIVRVCNLVSTTTQVLTIFRFTEE